MMIAFLAPDERHHLELGVDGDAEAVGVPGRHRVTEYGQPPSSSQRIGVVVGIDRCADESVENMRRRRLIWIADAETDDIDAAVPRFLHSAARLLEQEG